MLNNFIKKKVSWKEDAVKILMAIFIFSCVGLFIYTQNHKRAQKIKEHHAYTIGTIVGYNRTGGVKRSLKYTIIYNKKTYTGGYRFYSKDNEKYTIGKKYLIVLNFKNPNDNVFIPYLLPDSIKAPPEGWDKPPLGIQEKDVIKYLNENY